MTQSIRKFTIMLVMTLTAATPVWAATATYSSMSNEELSSTRGTMREASEDE